MEEDNDGAEEDVEQYNDSGGTQDSQNLVDERELETINSFGLVCPLVYGRFHDIYFLVFNFNV